MVELTRSNDPVFISWLTARLAAAEIDSVVLDQHASVLDGSICAVQRRVMVDDGDLWRARKILAEAETIDADAARGGD